MLSFGAPLFLWALLGLPLVALLHFLHRRRQHADVSALFLWRRARDLSQEQRRFSPTWLLILQLAFVALAALALAQPSLRLAGAPERVLVVDASASMAAADRLPQAVATAKELLAGSGRVAVVRAGLDATVVQPLTSDHARAATALEGLVAADARAELGRALELARSLAPGAEVVVFSDRRPPEVAGSRWRPVGKAEHNLGISAFELRMGQAFVSVVSSDARPQEVAVELRQDGRTVARTSLLVPAAGQANASFPVSSSGFYQAVLAVPDGDALALDDTAYAGSRDLRILLSPGAPELARALSVIPGVTLQNAGSSPAVGSYDVRALQGLPGPKPRPGRTLYFAPKRADATRQEIRDWDRTDPLLRFVDFTGFGVGVARDLPPLPGQGWQVLAQTADLTPVILRRSSPGSTEVVWRFHPSQADVQRLAFPIMLINLTDAFRGENRLEMGSLLPRGRSLQVNGRPERLSRASMPGVYRVGDEVYAVSLLSEAESRLAAPPAAPQAEPAPATPQGERRRDLALPLLLAALLLLLGEWLLWSRGQRSWAGQG